MTTHDRHHAPHTATEYQGLHQRLTVLPAGARERSSLLAHLARLDPDGRGAAVETVRLDDLRKTAREVAKRRVVEHARLRDELTAQLREAREHQAVTASQRDEAAARARRLAAHQAECDELIEQADELTVTADEAQRHLDERRTELEAARDRMAVVQDQRDAATRAIEDAKSQLADLEAAELDESTLRRELEKAGEALRAAETAHLEANAAIDAIEARAGERAALRRQLAAERAELMAQAEAPLVDPAPLQQALSAFDAEARLDQADPLAHDLLREWLEVDDELARIEGALPAPPSQDDLDTAQHNLSELQNLIGQLEQASHHGGALHPAARDQIEASHEAVLAAEEMVHQSGGHPEAHAQLDEARHTEQQVLASYGFHTYLDLVMAEPDTDQTQSELIDAVRAHRQAEDTLAELYAAAEPPQIVLTLRSRRERIFHEAAQLLGCDPGENLVELLETHPAVPRHRVAELAQMLADYYGVYPVGVSLRDSAIDLLTELDNQVQVRETCWADVERIDVEAGALHEEDGHDAEEVQRLLDQVHVTAMEVDDRNERVRGLEYELMERSARDERRLQRVAAAEQLRAQIAAVTEALERSDDEYNRGVSDAENAAIAAEANLERANAALSDAIRKLRRIGDALPPALRPKPSDDPLGNLQVLRETLAGEVERAEVALGGTTRDLERARAMIDETQADLDAHLTEEPSGEADDDDLRESIAVMAGAGSGQLVFDDPFAGMDAAFRQTLLDELAVCAARRPIVLLTDHLDTLSWAIGLPDDVGAVTRLPDNPSQPVTRPPAVAPST